MPTKKPNKTKEVIAKIFKNPIMLYGLKEFEGTDFEKALYIIEKEKGVFCVEDNQSGQLRVVYNEEKQKGRPEEIIRQIWIYKLHHEYKYPLERIGVEKSIHFGREVNAKAADIIVYKEDKITPYIIIEVKIPSQKTGIEQLKSYLNAEGSEIGVWTNGNNRIILYRFYPKEFNDTLPELPKANQTIDDLLEAKKTLYDYTTEKADLKKIVENMEELVLANAGVDVFIEVFKLVYAKL